MPLGRIPAEGPSAIVNKIISFSSVDGPGNRTAIFLQGCNFTCLYCHNPETIGWCNHCAACIGACHTGALAFEAGKVRYRRELCVGCDSCLKVCRNLSSPKTKKMSVDEVAAAVKRNLPFIRGVTVSGGECTCQKEFLYELLAALNKTGLSCYLDSNGSLDFSKEQELMRTTDKVMLDVKAFDLQEHRTITGEDNEVVKRNLSYLAETGKLYEVRTVVVPGLFDAEQTIREVADLVLPFLPKQDIRYKLIAYRSMGVRPPFRDRFSTPEPEMMEKLKRVLQDKGWHNVVIL